MMRTTKSLFILTFAISIFSACTSGRQFNSGRFADLDLHRVKESEYVNIFGDPLQTTNMIVSGDKYRIVRYYYGSHPFFETYSVRNLYLEFKNEELNGYLYVSSFISDKTRVDFSKVANIKIGISTKDEVLSLLGKPYAKAFCPTQLEYFKDECTKAKEVWGWLMFKLGYASKVVEKKYVIIMFGENGKVVDFKAADVND
jgi:hypothetical protein